jgi:hypothetical protein
VIVVVTPFLIPLCHLAFSAFVFQKTSSSEVLALPPMTVVVREVRSAMGRKSSAACRVPDVELLCRKLPVDILDHGVPESWLVEPRTALNRGLSVAIQPAVIPTPISTVVQIAKSVVRYRKSPLYGLSVDVYGRRINVAVEPLEESSAS